MLQKKPQGCFSWSLIKFRSKQNLLLQDILTRDGEFAEKLWVLGGSTEHTSEYLNDHGEFINNGPIETITNQLLCFDPSLAERINPKCKGDIPEPHSDQPAAKIRDKVWMLGKNNRTCCGLYQLDMLSLIWTKIETTLPMSFADGPDFSMSTISDNQLVVHGGFRDSKKRSTTWIFSLPLLSWRQYMKTPPCNHVEDELQYNIYLSIWRHQRYGQTCTQGNNNTAVVIGGLNFCGEYYEDAQQNIHVMLEPKSLQQLATKVIHKHMTSLPWEILPRKLRALLNFL